MKCSKRQVRRKTHKIPHIQFEEQKLTSFSGLVLFQALFSRISLKERLQSCFAHLQLSSIFQHSVISLLLIVHLLLGFRRLRDNRYYRDDPMVKRLLGLNRLPDVATVSRQLACADEKSVGKLRGLCRKLCLDRLRSLALRRLTLDFDGSVQSTMRSAEATAVGFNKKKKGARSYYPLFCTIAQTGQVFDLFHRSGNVHDSNGAKAFICQCVQFIRACLGNVDLEVRMDAAYFSDEIVSALHELGIEFTISVPFERFAELKTIIAQRKRWKHLNRDFSFFENNWKPKKWNDRYRFLFIRQRVRRQHKEPVQLDLFIPYECGFDFKVIITNKLSSAKKILAFHNGRGEQEGIFAELKSHCQMDYVPVKTKVGNQIYLLSAVLAHNLARELQMLANPRQRNTTEKRSPLWIFQELNTLRRNLIQRAGRLTTPHGTLTLTISANKKVGDELIHYLDAARAA